MHIPRVLARSDQAAAEELLERAISLAKELEGSAASLLLGNAVYLAAAVSPKQALQLYRERRGSDPFGGAVDSLVNAMAQHEHVEDALQYLADPLPGDRFPMHYVNNLAGECRDDETRLKLLTLAARAWKERASGDENPEEHFAGPAFNTFFGRQWGLLTPAEARPIQKDLLQWAFEEKSEPRNYPLTGNPEDPELASQKEHHLFKLLPALQVLEPEVAGLVLEDHPQLAIAWGSGFRRACCQCGKKSPNLIVRPMITC